MVNNCELNLTTGEVAHQVLDVELPSLVPLTLMRRYVSSVRDRDLLGNGWMHNFTRTATSGEQGVTKHDSLGGDTFFPAADCDGVKGPAVELVRSGRRARPGETASAIEDLERETGSKLGRDLLVLGYPDGSREVYVAAGQGPHWLLVHYRDADGNTQTRRYDGDRLSEIRTQEGPLVRLSYTGGGLVSRVAVHESAASDKPLLEVTYRYDARGDLVSYTDETGSPWGYDYDDGLLVRSVDHNGVGRNYLYDEQRRCVGAWSDGGHQVRMVAHDPVRHYVLVTDSYGARTLYRLNEDGAIVAHVDPKGQVTERILGEGGSVLATINADGSSGPMYTVDPETGVLAESDGSGGTWRTEFDDKGRMARVTGPGGQVRAHEYDARGRVVKITAPGGGVVRYEYDARGNLSRLVDPTGYEIRREAREDGRVVRVFDRLGSLFQQRFDALGNLVSETDAAGRETRYTYVAPDYPGTITYPGGAVDTYGYDRAMNPVAHTDALGHTRRTEYDAYGNLTAEADPTGGRVCYAFDHEDNLRSVTNEKGETLEFGYDALYRQVWMKSFDDKLVRYELDALDRRVAIVDGEGRRTRIRYHGGEDVARREFFDGAVEQYLLNPDSRYEGIAFTAPPGSGEPDRSAEFAYDANGNVASETHNGRTIRYECDAANYLVSIRDSLGGDTLYARDARHRVERITDRGREFRLSRLPTGEVTEIAYPNGLRQSFAYDAAGRMSERRMLGAGGRVLTWRRFAYDACDQLVAMEDWHWGRFHYRYDAAGRLRAVVGADGKTAVEAYAYDATGNMVQGPLAGAVTVARGNRVSAAGGRQFAYDGNGCLTERREAGARWQFEWDRDEHLKRVVRDGKAVGDYEYDLLSRRVRKTTPQGSVEFQYETYALRAEIFEDGTLNHYVSLPALPVPIARCDRAGDWSYYTYDQVGTPTEVFDEAGQLLLSVRPQAFGGARQEYRPTGSTVALPFGFMGQYVDDESGLFYNHFRYYDPALGRYVSQDPLGIQVGLNLYSYPTNPNNWVDPYGLMPVFVCLPHWGACQQWYARQKVAAVNEAMKTRTLKKTCTCCPPSKGGRADQQRSDFEGKCGGGTGSAGVGRQIDHMHELQAAGFDRCCSNLRSVEATFNNDLGKQTKSMMKNLNYGDKIGKITTSGCTGKGKCSKAGQRRTARPPPNANQKCAKKDAKPLKCKC